MTYLRIQLNHKTKIIILQKQKFWFCIVSIKIMAAKLSFFIYELHELYEFLLSSKSFNLLYPDPDNDAESCYTKSLLADLIGNASGR